MDLGLDKTWKMFYNENHQLQFRWEVFNLTNTQEFVGLDFSRTGYGIPAVSGGVANQPAPNFTNWTSVNPNSNRVMQFGLRYSF
jgi:hypothetical protein